VLVAREFIAKLPCLRRCAAAASPAESFVASAIRNKRARIEEINLILAQPRAKGASGGSVRNLIEKRLHLEQSVAELEAERHRLQLQNADELFRWEDFDQRLLSPKANDLAQEMHQRAAEAQRRIAYETAQSICPDRHS
jgi:hypothetical protein